MGQEETYSVDERAALIAALSRLNLLVEDPKQELLLKHLNLVFEKNKVLNLTRITSLEEAIVLHIEDSLSIYKEFSHKDGKYCDIGTGAGYPGIPLGIISGRKGTLIDSVQKKAHAVGEFIQTLGLDQQLTVRAIRSEELAQSEPESFETVIARAVASLSTLEELASPLLGKGGRLIAMKGRETKEDLDIAIGSSKKLGLEFLSVRNFEIGGGLYQRAVYVFEKVADPSIKLPRRPGMAQKHPIL